MDIDDFDTASDTSDQDLGDAGDDTKNFYACREDLLFELLLGAIRTRFK